MSGAVVTLLIGIGGALVGIPLALYVFWYDRRARHRTPPAPPRAEDLAAVAADLARLSWRLRALAAGAADAGAAEQPRDEHVGATA